MCIAISNHTHTYIVFYFYEQIHQVQHTHTHQKKVSRIDMNERRLVGVLKYCRYVVVVKLKHPPVFFFPALYFLCHLQIRRGGLKDCQIMQQT